VTPDVAEFLLVVISQLTLTIGADTFERDAVLMIEAKRQLSQLADASDARRIP